MTTLSAQGDNPRSTGTGKPGQGNPPVLAGERPQSPQEISSGGSVSSVLGQLVRSPRYVVAFVVTAAALGLLYSILLTFAFTQRFSVANWHFLDTYRIGWSAVLALAMAFVVTVQIYALRRLAELRTGAVGGMAFVTGLLPSLLCCSPIIPNLLAFAGVSTVSLYSTTGTLQDFFITHETQFLAGSLALLVISGWWGLRRAARSACFRSEGCTIEGLPQARMQDEPRPTPKTAAARAESYSRR